jgi:hypothetical protein
MSTRGDVVEGHPTAMDPALRAFLVEMQRGLIAQANAARRLLGLPPVVTPDKRDRS